MTSVIGNNITLASEENVVIIKIINNNNGLTNLHSALREG